jgi:uncharacterized protein
MTTELYGRGTTFPLAIGPTGGVRQSTGIERVEESIRVILGTQHGERVMRPTFGCNLKSLAFAPNGAGTANLARHYVETGLREWEPRIEVVEVAVANDRERGALVVTVNYRLKAATGVHSVVFPFYLEQP